MWCAQGVIAVQSGIENIDLADGALPAAGQVISVLVNKSWHAC